jgi:hypothetical protein
MKLFQYITSIYIFVSSFYVRHMNNFNYQNEEMMKHITSIVSELSKLESNI